MPEKEQQTLPPPSVAIPAYETAERMNTWPHSAGARAERLIAAGRVVLSIFALLTIWLDPREPAKHAHVTYLLLAGYAFYSALLMLVVWTSRAAVRPVRIVTHASDLALYTVFIYLTEGTTSPFFAYLVFSILCGAIRWRWRGALVTAAAAIAAYVGLGVYAEQVLKDPAFQLDGFIFRAVYLAVIAGILTYVGVYEEQVRGEIKRLADWPRLVPGDRSELVRQLLGHAGHIVGAPRVLFVWEEPEEPWLHVALWSASDFRFHRYPPDRYVPVVTDVLEHVPFMCRDAVGGGRTLFATGGSLREWRGASIHARLAADFHVRSVLAIPLPGERLSGWLFYLDKRRPTYDDVTVGTISAREMIASLDHAELLTRQRETAVSAERTRLGRDLHDGLLQSLTAARLQLHQLVRQASDAGGQTIQKLEALEAAMSADQRDLRRLVEQLQPGKSASQPTAGLAETIDHMRERMRGDWGLDVRTKVDGCLTMPPGTARDVSLMISEALVNAARHGHASAADVRVTAEADRVTVRVADNGCGFPFHGRRTDADLAREQTGPVSLRERVASLDGRLVVDSSRAGACIEITLPITGGV